MDPVGAIASIGQIIDLTFKVAQYLKDIKDAPAARRKVQREVNSLLSLLNDLQYRIEEADISEPWFQSLCSLTAPNGVLDQIKAVTEELENKLHPVGTMKRIGRALIWTLDKKETDDMLSRIDRLKNDVIISLQKDHFTLSQETDKGMVNVHKNVLEITDSVSAIRLDQRKGVLTGHRLRVADWISRLSFHQTHAAVLSSRKTGTCRWFLESDHFQQWIKGVSRILWCPGIPGAGKTIIAATVIDYIQTECMDTDTGLAFIYCDYKEQPYQTAVNLISSLLKQLATQEPSILDDVAILHKQHSFQNTRPAITELLEELQSAASSFTNVFIVIDALDECPEENGSREGLLESLRALPKKVHLMFTSRPHIRIDRSFPDVQELEIIANTDDMRTYIEARISQTPRLVRIINQRPDIRDMIKDKILEKIKGMFLLARLHVDSISNKSSPKMVIKALNDLSTSLDDAYKKASERIDAQEPEDQLLALRTIYWITLAKTSLTVSELQHALAVEAGSSRLDKDAIFDEETLLLVCAGLVNIDTNTNIISLVHYTTQDYFEKIQQKRYPDGPLEIATTCLTYLLFDDFATGACTLDEELLTRLNDNPFLEYAARYWSEHARGEIEYTIDKIILELLQDTFRLSCYVQIMYMPSYLYEGFSQYFPREVSGLHVAVASGLTYITFLLLEKGADIEARDDDGKTALHCAAERGHEVVMRILLEKGADVEAKDDDGKTALHWTARDGHEAVIRLLLERGANVNAQNEYGQTILHKAAGRGHEALVRLLLEKGADIYVQNEYGRTALHRAAGRGHEAVVRLLLEKGASVDVQNQHGRTALHEAAQGGHEAVLRLLLSTGASVEIKDVEGSTAIHWAAKLDQENIVKLLSLHVADVPTSNSQDWTAQHETLYHTNYQEGLISSTGIQKASRKDAGTSEKSSSTGKHDLMLEHVEGGAHIGDVFDDALDEDTASTLSDFSGTPSMMSRGESSISSVSSSSQIRQDGVDEFAELLFEYHGLRDLFITVSKSQDSQRDLFNNLDSFLKQFSDHIKSETKGTHYQAFVLMVLSRRKAITRNIRSKMLQKGKHESMRKALEREDEEFRRRKRIERLENYLHDEDPRVEKKNQADPKTVKEHMKNNMMEADSNLETVKEEDDKNKFPTEGDHPSADGDSEGDLEGLGEQSYESQKIHTILQDTKDFVISSNAFASLCYNLRQAVYKDIIADIEEQVISSLHHQSGEIYSIKFNVRWHLLKCVKEELKGDPKLGPVLTITGSPSVAFATTCREYLKWRWPRTGLNLLDVLETVIGPLFRDYFKHSAIDSQGPTLTFRNISMPTSRSEEFEQVFINAEGSVADLTDLAQQLTWMCATFRSGVSGQLSLSRVLLRQSVNSGFELIPLKLLPSDTRGKGTCWHPLFQNAVLADGFSIPERQGQTGLEIPFEVMTSLADVWYLAPYQNTLLLRGFSTIVFPKSIQYSNQKITNAEKKPQRHGLDAAKSEELRLEASHLLRPATRSTNAIQSNADTPELEKAISVQWHFLQSGDGDELSEECVHEFEKAPIKDPKVLGPARHFLGFCDHAKVYLGVRDHNYQGTTYSGASKQRQTHFRSGHSLGVSLSRMIGLKAEVSVTYRAPLITPQPETKDNLYKLLNKLKVMPIILYDFQEHSGWLVPASSVVLHAIHAHARSSYGFIEDINRLPYAEPHWDGGEAAREAIWNSRDVRLCPTGEDNNRPYTLRELVKQIWGNLMTFSKSLADRNESKSCTGYLGRSQGLLGWELMDIVEPPMISSLRECKLQRSAGDWYRLPLQDPNIIVLLSKGLGTAIKPSSQRWRCPKCTNPPLGKDYLMSTVKCIEYLTEKNGNTLPHKLSPELSWYRPEESIVFRSCEHHDRDSCLRVQQLSKRMPLGSQNSRKISENCRAGAVLFGGTDYDFVIQDGV